MYNNTPLYFPGLSPAYVNQTVKFRQLIHKLFTSKLTLDKLFYGQGMCFSLFKLGGSLGITGSDPFYFFPLIYYNANSSQAYGHS